MNAFREIFKAWVVEVLMRDQDCLSAKTGRLMMSKIHRKYFGKRKGTLAYATLQKLGKGLPGEPDSIKAFAGAVPLGPLDRTELFIRWGECLVNRYAYQVPKQQFNSFVRCWKDLPYQTVFDLQINPILRLVPPSAGVATGIKMYLEDSEQKLSSIKSGPYSTLARLAATGISNPKAFTRLLNKLRPLNPVTDAPFEAHLAYSRKELTLEKICADYIEAQLGCGRILRLRQSDLRKSFDPTVHVRTAAWLVRVCLPVQLGSTQIEPLYFP